MKIGIHQRPTIGMPLQLKKVSGVTMSKSAIKFYLVPGIIVLVIVGIILIIPFGKKKEVDKNPSPTIILPTRTPFPTSPAEAPSEGVTPTIIPIQNFTGADINQTLPLELKNIGEQKTALRRLTPLTLAFATIEFDYENDLFLVRLLDPKEESKIQFNSWKDQNYPALTENKFIFN